MKTLLILTLFLIVLLLPNTARAQKDTVITGTAGFDGDTLQYELKIDSPAFTVHLQKGEEKDSLEQQLLIDSVEFHDNLSSLVDSVYTRIGDAKPADTLKIKLSRAIWKDIETYKDSEEAEPAANDPGEGDEEEKTESEKILAELKKLINELDEDEGETAFLLVLQDSFPLLDKPLPTRGSQQEKRVIFDTTKAGEKKIFKTNYAYVKLRNNRVHEILVNATYVPTGQVKNFRNNKWSLTMADFNHDIGFIEGVEVGKGDSKDTGIVYFSHMLKLTPDSETGSFSINFTDKEGYLKPLDTLTAIKKSFNEYLAVLVMTSIWGEENRVNNTIQTDFSLHVPLNSRNIMEAVYLPYLKGSLTLTNLLNDTRIENSVDSIDQSLDLEYFELLNYNRGFFKVQVPIILTEAKMFETRYTALGVLPKWKCINWIKWIKWIPLPLELEYNLYLTGLQTKVVSNGEDTLLKSSVFSSSYGANWLFSIRPEQEFGINLRFGRHYLVPHSLTSDVLSINYLPERQYWKAGTEAFFAVGSTDENKRKSGVYFRGDFYFSHDFDKIFPLISVGYSTNLGGYLSQEN
ncbi:MAG: hypothetical protein WD077_09085 [Bacteroidia bacterium]